MDKQQRKKQAKKEKLPFWKKVGPELEHLFEHLGKTADNMRINDWADLAIIGGLAYLGYKEFKNPAGLLVGPIAYKLATTMGGTPPVSQISGLVILGSMGIINYYGMDFGDLQNVAGRETSLQTMEVTTKEQAQTWLNLLDSTAAVLAQAHDHVTRYQLAQRLGLMDKLKKVMDLLGRSSEIPIGY
jgi:hypothetical protein